MPDINPIHYLLAGCVVLLLGTLGYCQVLGIELRASEGQFRSFVAETKAKGVTQNAKTAEENHRLQKNTEIANSENSHARDSILAYANKLRELAGSSSRKLPNTPSVTGSVKEAGVPESSGEMGSYLDGMADIRKRATELVIEGAENTVDLNTAKTWADGLQSK